MYIPRLVRAVQLNRQMETGTKKKNTQSTADSHTNTLTPAPSPWHSFSSPIEMSAVRAVLSSSITSEPRTRLVTSDTPLAEGSPRLPGWAKCQCQRGSEGERGCDLGAAKGSAGTSRFYYKVCCDKDARKHLGTCACRRSLVTFSCFSDIWARLLLPMPHHRPCVQWELKNECSICYKCPMKEVCNSVTVRYPSSCQVFEWECGFCSKESSVSVARLMGAGEENAAQLAG